MTVDQDPATRPEWWRTVLGEYPTGVSLITSLDDAGDDIGMVVGTFSAVSEHPPMISFMPVRSSRSWAQVRERGRFAVSVLGSEHEQICRMFATRHPDRFDRAQWVEGAGGIRRLADAVVWFDAEIDTVVPAGDHDIVIARVHDFGVGAGDAGLPLLYLKGGYGSFAIPSLQFDAQAMSWQLRLSDLLRPSIEAFALDTGFECTLVGLAQDSIIVLSAANAGQRSGVDRLRRPVGAAFPFAAPFGAAFAAWGDEARSRTWLENSRHLIGTIDRTALADLLDSVRRVGYSVTTDHDIAEEFERLFESEAPAQSAIREFWRQVSELGAVGLPGGSEAEHLEEIDSIQLPVFGSDGSALLVLSVGALGSNLLPEQRRVVIDRLVAFAAELTELAVASGITESPETRRP